MNWIKRLFIKRKRYSLLWSEDFLAWQVYLLTKESKVIYGGHYSPAYFKGWATTDETNKDALRKFEATFQNPRYK